jgi:spermidine synthase
MLLVFAFTLFTSATLLFLVEPMIGKMILPLLGGTPAVWNTCMVFYQAVLLLGYGYAHLSTTWLGARKQAAIHVVLLLLPFVFLPLAVNRDLIRGEDNPIVGLLLILSLSVGLPMFVVSASAPLLQKWFASTSHPAAKDPYFLYGASNLGSMLALVAYPLLVEPHLRLREQSIDWSVGYSVLVALTVLCAVFLWLSPRNVEVEEKVEESKAEKAPASGRRPSEAIKPARHGIRTGGKPPTPAEPDAAISHTLTGEVTWRRVLRWVALAFVPSSLMLGATTYITTDIAAIPLLWVVPLALYLLSFILVFSHIPAWLQYLIVTGWCAVIAVLFCNFLWGAATSMGMQLFMIVLISAIVGSCLYGAWWLWTIRDNHLLHRAMVLQLPLLVLALLFFMLSELKTKTHWIAWSLTIHLTTLFVVSMVCHGELARDRPAPKYLTGYFLWMSVGGVLGGLFNGLVAPLIFTGIAEYELAMMLACFLAPPLSATKTTDWGQRVDVILAGLFMLVGGVLIALRLRDHDLAWDIIEDGPWLWQLAALLVGLAVAAVVAGRARERRFDHWMDLILPLTLAILLIGLSWGLWSNALLVRVRKIAEALSLSPYYFRRILTYGVPVVLCYTFVERSLRFALGIGAILLASSFCGTLNDNVMHQERSFFGVLKVENEENEFGDEQFYFRRLIHGTTLHGMQFLNEDRRDEPLTYYHRSGPIGEVMLAYNMPERLPNLAVIGLGTGTMACYARPGQHLTFYDIDPVVRRLSFDGNPAYFGYVHDARERGAHLELVMGDARLTMERKHLEDSEKYGIIVVDAFSSDAIPIHLITHEAMQVYLDKLTPDGLLAFHISNRYLDLRPVLYNLAQERHLAAVYQSDDREVDPRSTAMLGKSSSTWVVLARKKHYLDGLRALNEWEDKRKDVWAELMPLSLWPDPGLGMSGQAMLVRNLLDEAISRRPSKWKELEPDVTWPDLAKVGVWTDDYSNLLSVFDW